MYNAEELVHLIKHISAQQQSEWTPFVWAHVSSYDPKGHRVRVIYPSLRDAETGKPVLSNWMQLGTLVSGNGYGFQFAPFGGATFDNPTAGEQVQVHFVNRDGSITACAHLSFNQEALPPYQQMLPGEVGIKSPGGSSLYFRHDGQGNEDVEVVSERHVTLTAKQDVTIVASEGKVSVAAEGDVDVSAKGNVNVTGKKIVLANGGPAVARVGDTTTCPAGQGRITSGSQTVTSG